MTVAETAPAQAGHEQSRARYPDEEGFVERDGVRVFWESYGEGEQTLLLLPTWTFAHSRAWKAQIGYCARHFRVVTFDPRGNGRSDRPTEPSAYDEAEFAQDAIDVMDACGVERVVGVANSSGAQRGLLLAAEHPERVAGMVLIGPWAPVSRLRSLRWRVMAHPWLRPFAQKRPLIARGWGKFNLAYWRSADGFDDFAEWWARKMLNEPHSTKQIEDAIAWAHETDGATLAASALGERAAPPTRKDQIALAKKVRCPVLVIHGTDDQITPYADGKALAEITGGRLETVEGAGHLPHARKPVQVNLALREFVDGTPRSDPTVYRSDGRKRALFISSPIGLGHAQRDVAIARELRERVDGLQIDWLAQNPVTRVLEAEGERIHPGSEHLANESRHIESESAEHDLHCFQAWRRMDEILINNFMVFHDVAREERYDERERNDRSEGQDRRILRHDLEHGEGDDLGRQYQRYEQPEHNFGSLSAAFVGVLSLSFARRFRKDHLPVWYGRQTPRVHPDRYLDPTSPPGPRSDPASARRVGVRCPSGAKRRV